MFDVFDMIAYLYKEFKKYDEYDMVTNYLCLVEKQKYLEEYNNIVPKLSIVQILDLDFSLIKESFVKSQKFSDPIFLLFSLNQLDSKISDFDTIYFDKDLDEGYSEFKPLNSEYTDSVLVYPQIWRRCHWGNSPEKLSGNINSILSSVFLVKKSDLGKFTISNYYIEANGFENSIHFIVGGSPISNDDVTNPSYIIQNNCNILKVNVDYPDEKIDEYINRIIAIINKADQNKVSLICFPELTSTEEINCKLIDKLSSMTFENLRIIALPTLYEKTNYGSVYYTESQTVLFDQCKTFAYISKRTDSMSKECLKENHNLCILNIKGVGRVVFPICKDMLVGDYINLCRTLGIALIATRSFSPGYGGYKYFSRIIKGYTSFDCSGLWINSCRYQSQDESKVVCITAHSQKEEDSYNRTYKCPKNCEECLFTFQVN